VTRVVTVTRVVLEQEVTVVVKLGALTVEVSVMETVSVWTPFCSELEFIGMVAELGNVES